jgi:S1-C subfamily serine protease
MKRFRYAIIVAAVIVAGCHLTTEDSAKPPVQGTENTETLVIDLSKALPSNPYQTEYEMMLYPTVRIKALFSTGSGVVIGDYIISAAHVVSDESIIAVETFSPEHIEIEAVVLVTDTIKDLALIKPVKKLPYSARLAPEDYTPYIFTPVWAVGCSLGLPPRPSYGHITSIDSSSFVSIRGYEISAPILPGNSGGPVFAIVPSDDGNASTYAVIGIAVWIHTYQGQLVTTMGGVVPIDQIYEFLKEYTDSTD